MSLCKRIARIARTTVLLASFAALPAGAVTIQEGSVAGGDFSNAWATPTVIAPGYDLVQGVGGGNDYDIFAITGMTPGAQTVTLDFSAPSGIGWSYAAGGSLMYSTSPFRWAWDGTSFGSLALSYLTPAQSFTLNLDSSFGGALYLGLYFTYGQNITYSVSLPGNAPAVPLPATAGLLGSVAAGLAAFGALGRQKRRKSAQI